jgi:hypothetical protein
VGANSGSDNDNGLDGNPLSTIKKLENATYDKEAKDDAYREGNIITGFEQGSASNCVMVASIKAAMEKYGQRPEDVFSSVEKTDDGYKVTLRNGEEVTLTESELEQAKELSEFQGDDKEMLANANFIYAVMAKHGANQLNGGESSNEDYIEVLHEMADSDGESTDTGFILLGLDYTKDNNVGKGSGIASRGPESGETLGHAAFVSNGSLDNYGEVASLDIQKYNRDAYQLV